MKKQRKKPPELRESEVKRDERGRIPPGVSGNPGGQSKEKRAFLERLKGDSDDVYESFIALVREGNPPAVLRAVEYLACKPPAAPADNAALERAGLTVVVQRLAEPKEPA